ncbi:hypothetical protein PG984_012345 [Apiospora sp. TS-2023a]
MDDVLQEFDNIRQDEPSQLRSLMDKAQRIISKDDDGDFTLDEVNKTIEDLEGMLYQGIIFEPRPNSKLHIKDFDKLSLTLPSIIIQLKERREGLPILYLGTRTTWPWSSCGPEDSFLVWLQFNWGEPPMGMEQRGNILQFVTLCVIPQKGGIKHKAQRLFFVSTPDSRLANGLGLLSSLRPAPLDPANLAVIQQCLRSEDSNTVKSGFIPRRLVDLGPTDQSLPQVVDTTFSGESIVDQLYEYATLSYCWGPPEDASQQLILTAESKHRLYQGFPLSDLTPVVRDAVVTCRTLGFRFLWIDALCILQHDTADWEEQSYDMERIFTGSALCICVMMSSSCLEGFLQQRTYTRLHLPWVSTINGLTFKETIDLTPCPIDYTRSRINAASIPPLELNIRRSPWCSRGWVFPPRKLYFGSDMIHVHVDQVITSENGYVFKDLFNDKANGFGDQFGIQPYYSLGRDTIISRSDAFPDMWYSIIMHFADLQWTDELDILPGLSGIARMFLDVYACKYVAGIWTNDIECGLLFLTCGMAEESTFHEFLDYIFSGGDGIGPSWSWVQWNGRLNGFVLSLAGNYLCRVRSHIRSEIHLLGVENQTNGRNPLGRVHFAALEISGTLLEISDAWELAAEKGKYSWCTMPEGQLIYVTTDWDTGMAIQDEDRHKLRLLLLVSCCSEPPETIRDWVEQEDGEWRFGLKSWRESVLMRPEYRQTFYQDRNRGDNGPGRCTLCRPGHERDVWGLLIYPAAQPGTYYRVGTFQSRALHGGLSTFKHGYTDTITLI